MTDEDEIGKLKLHEEMEEKRKMWDFKAFKMLILKSQGLCKALTAPYFYTLTFITWLFEE
jgi:hypothetical protein